MQCSRFIVSDPGSYLASPTEVEGVTFVDKFTPRSAAEAVHLYIERLACAIVDSTCDRLLMRHLRASSVLFSDLALAKTAMRLLSEHPSSSDPLSSTHLTFPREKLYRTLNLPAKNRGRHSCRLRYCETSAANVPRSLRASIG